MRSLAACGAVVLAVAGCGYLEDEPGAASPPEAFELFVTAVKERDSAGVELISRRLESRQRASYLDAMREHVAPLDPGYRVILDARVDERLAVVGAEGAGDRPPGAFAAVLVKEGETWFVDPQSLLLVYGVSATSGSETAANPVVDFQVNAPSGPTQRLEGRLWLDGRELSVRRTDPEGQRFVARVRRVRKGKHSVVAFAKLRERRHAIAWTFTAE